MCYLTDYTGIKANAGMKRSNTGILGYWDTGIKDNTGIKRSNAGDGKRMNRMSPSAGMNEFLRNGWLDE